MRKKVISCLLVATMVAGAFGCMPVSAESTTEGTGDPTELSMFVDMSWFWYDKWGTDSISQEITKKTGVSFDVTRSTGGDNLPLLIAGGDLPDVVYASAEDHIAALCDPEVCWTYDELMEKYPDIDLGITDEERVYNETLSQDGKLYCVRNAMVPSDYEGDRLAGGGESYLIYRKDILDKLGLKEPTSMDELEDVLLKVKEAYPDMVPLCWRDGYTDFFATEMGHGAWWGIGYKNDDDKESGQMALWLDCDGTKDVYATINRFAREGLLNAETTTYDEQQTFELMMESGKGFACISSVTEGLVFQNAANEVGDTEQVWTIMTEPFAGYQKYYGLSGWAGYFITKNCKDPEAALRLYAYMRSDEGRRLGSWGIEGVDWKWDENGHYAHTDEYEEFLANGGSNQLDKGIGVWIFGDQGEERTAVDLSRLKDRSELTEGTGEYETTLYTYAMLNYAKVIKAYPEITFVVPNSGTDLKNKYDALMDAMASLEAKVEFAESEEDFEKAWTDMVDQANAYGMQEINEYATQLVADYRANNG